MSVIRIECFKQTCDFCEQNNKLISQFDFLRIVSKIYDPHGGSLKDFFEQIINDHNGVIWYCLEE